MVKREILDSFKNLNLKQYIDKTLTNTDKSILKTELYKHEKIEKEIKDEMFKTYSANIDHLVDILDKTHKINKLYEEIQDDLVEYRSVFKYFDKDDDDGSYVDNEKQKEFRELISKFDKEAEVFVTEKRYVLHSDVFYAEEENMKKSFMLMFCNDLLIIGKKTANKYVLKNAFNYSVIKVIGDDDKLIITVDPFEFVYRKDKTSVDRAVEVYKEVTYKNKAVDDRPKDNKNDDSEIVDYLIFTEQYDKLVNYKACINTDIDFENIKIDFTILPQFLDVFLTDKSRKKFFYKYLSNTIEKRLFNVDIVQKLDGLITDMFIEFHDFCREARKLFDDYCVKYGNKRSDEAVFILFINYQIQSIFNMLRKRIFGKHSSIENVNNYIDMIRDKLYFLGYDFRYMIDMFDMFDKDKEEKQEQSYEETKEAIVKLLDEMVVEEYM